MDFNKITHKELDRLLILKKLSYVDTLKKYGFLSMIQKLRSYLDSRLVTVLVLTFQDVTESELNETNRKVSKLHQLGYKVQVRVVSNDPRHISDILSHHLRGI